MWKHPSQDGVKSVKQRCSRCHASGRIPCEFCGGKGDIVGGRDTNGNPKYARCNSCFGLKMMRCRNCGGEGFV